jgi:hypothetical protein
MIDTAAGSPAYLADHTTFYVFHGDRLPLSYSWTPFPNVREA